MHDGSHVPISALVTQSQHLSVAALLPVKGILLRLDVWSLVFACLLLTCTTDMHCTVHCTRAQSPLPSCRESQCAAWPHPIPIRVHVRHLLCNEDGVAHHHNAVRRLASRPAKPHASSTRPGAQQPSLKRPHKQHKPQVALPKQRLPHYQPPLRVLPMQMHSLAILTPSLPVCCTCCPSCLHCGPACRPQGSCQRNWHSNCWHKKQLQHNRTPRLLHMPLDPDRQQGIAVVLELRQVWVQWQVSLVLLMRRKMPNCLGVPVALPSRNNMARALSTSLQNPLTCGRWELHVAVTVEQLALMRLGIRPQAVGLQGLVHRQACAVRNSRSSSPLAQHINCSMQLTLCRQGPAQCHQWNSRWSSCCTF